jgi:beta-lactamase superfamily II metal-dependent hydrolase
MNIKRLFVYALPLLLAMPALRAADTLDIYVIDTEGGKSVVIQSPGGESMLVDAGNPTRDDRDTKRIVSAAQAMGIKQFDYIVCTHYDGDHVANITNVDAQIPGRIFVDHGKPLPTATTPSVPRDYTNYLKMVGSRTRVIVKPGDVIPLKGVDVTVVTANGEVLAKPLPGGGQPNEFAAEAKPEPIDDWDNAGSIGLFYQFGKFRMLDLADLLQLMECKLMAPTNLVGSVDLLMVSHHGLKLSNSKLLVHPLHPKVAIMNNGPRKGGEAQVFDVYKSSPGFVDMWQAHFSPTIAEKNSPPDFIANLTDPCEGKSIKVSAQRDGTFTVTNLRNGFSKTYKP